MTASEGHTCAIRGTNGGALYCWGANHSGEVGDGTTTNRNAPTRVGTLTDWKVVSVGAHHSCAIRGTKGGALHCWGRNDFSQLGDGTTISRLAPKKIGSSSDWRSISSGELQSCAIREVDAGTLYCWGHNGAGQLGDGTTTSRSVPKHIGNLTKWNAIAVGAAHTCAIRGNSRVLSCWGHNAYGQVGDSTQVNRTVPKQISIS